MAISKKSLGKVLAISMASAMAMSSLSAALVSVSAVSDPALASNGNVDYSTIGGAEAAIQTAFSNKIADLDDDVIDVIAGGTVNIKSLKDAIEAHDNNDTDAWFTYTDADGLEVPLTKTTAEFKITSGPSYLKYYDKDVKDRAGNTIHNAGDLEAQSKSGSATLQIKVTGYADIGGGRDERKVSFTQDIKFDVHQAGEIGLKATVDNGASFLNEADLNDLAAYGSSVQYQLVQYKTPAQEGSFYPEIAEMKVGDSATVEQGTATNTQQQQKIENDIESGILAALNLEAIEDADSATKANVTAFINAVVAAAAPVAPQAIPGDEETGVKYAIADEDTWTTLAAMPIRAAGYAKYTEEALLDSLKAAVAAENQTDYVDLSGTNTVAGIDEGIYATTAEKEHKVQGKATSTIEENDQAVAITAFKGAAAADKIEVILDANGKVTGKLAKPSTTYTGTRKLTVNTNGGVTAEMVADAYTAAQNSSEATEKAKWADIVMIGSGATAEFYSVAASAPSQAPTTIEVQINNSPVAAFSGVENVTAGKALIATAADNTGVATAWDIVDSTKIDDLFLMGRTKDATDTEKNQDIFEVDLTKTVKAKNAGNLFKYGAWDTVDAENDEQAKVDLKPVVENAYFEAINVEVPAPTASVVEDGMKVWGIRFYAGSGQDLFDVTKIGATGVGGNAQPTAPDWVRSTKTNTTGVVPIEGNAASNDGSITLDTNGSVGSGSIKVAVSYINPNTDLANDGVSLKPNVRPKVLEETLDVKVVRAADFGSEDVTIDRSGSKTYVSECANDVTNEKNISGFEIRTSGDVTIDNGTVGAIKNALVVTVNGGRAGTIDIDEDTGSVIVTEQGVVGDIIAAASVNVNEGGQAGNITADADVTLSEGSIASIDVDGTVTIAGGDVSGNVTATGDIVITSEESDGNDNALDTTIGGNVTLLAGGNAASISINNDSNEGKADLTIRGNITAKHVDTDNSTDAATISIGDADTTGLIQIGGIVEGEVVQLGGNGLVSLAGVRAANEVERTDDDAEIIESTLIFEGFNSAINSINNFAKVKVNDGTVIVKGAVDTNELTVYSDAQIVADSITVEDDIVDGGSIVVPAGKLTVTGKVEGSPTLALTGELAEGTLAFVGNRSLVDAFDMGGITLRAERLSNGNYNYLIDKIELNGLTAIGKDVATGVKQEKNVSVALDGTLPEGASIVWESDDADIATVAGNGTTATITGAEVGTTSVTAKIVDANGRELGYDDAVFDVNVLDNATVDSIGGDIGPDDNQVDLDTKKKNMEAGQVYTFMVRGNNDVDNLSVTSGDTNVATVALANGADSRGALYNITAVADGKTDITVTYQGKTSKIAVKVGGFQLDTSSKKMAPGQVYSVLAKNVPADQAGNVTLAYDSNIVDVVKVNDNYNGRGVLFNVTAKAIGETEVKATYNNETETMAVNVVENTGRLTLDTASYTMPFGGSYTIGVKVEKNGRELTGEEVRAMITSGELVVSDSRTGSIVTTEVQANGNVRVTGRQNEGTTYVQFIVMQNGQRVTHASVGVTVQNGATAGGSSVRSISQW